MQEAVRPDGLGSETGAGGGRVDGGGGPGRPPASSPAGSLSRQAGIIILARATAFLLAFAVPIVLVRVIEDPHEYGLYRQSVFLLAIFSPILQFGMTQSLYYFFPREPRTRAALLTQTVGFLALVGAFFAVALVVGRDLVAAYFKEPAMAAFMPIVGPYVALMVVTSILEVLPIVQQRMRLTFSIIVASEALRMMLLLGAAVFTRDVRIMLLALLVFAAVRAVFLLGLLQHQGLVAGGAPGRGFLGSQLAYAVPFGLAGTVVTLIQMTDRLFVSRYFDAAHFAVYSIGCFQMPIIMIVFTSASSVMLGRMASLQAEGRREEMAALIASAVRKLALVALPVTALCLVLAREIIVVLFTEQYAAAVPIFMVFLALIPRAATTYGAVVRAYGLTAWIFRVTLVALAVAVALTFALIGPLGLLGPAIAVVLALWIVAGAQIWRTGRLLGTGLAGLYRWGDMARIAALSAALALGLVAARAALAPPPAVALVGGGGLYLGLFGWIGARSGIIRAAEVTAVRREIRLRTGIG